MPRPPLAAALLLLISPLAAAGPRAPKAKAAPRKTEAKPQAPATIDDFLKDNQAARTALDQGDAKTAEKAAAEEPGAYAPKDVSRALAARGDLRLRLGRAAAGEADLRAAVAADPMNPDALRALATRLLETGHPAEALIYANHQILEQAPDLKGEAKSRPFVERALLELALEMYDRAENDLKSALKFSPDDRLALRAMTSYWQKRGRAAEGLSYAERLVSLSKSGKPEEKAFALTERARLFLEAKQLSKAERDLREALAAVPDDPSATQQLAQCLWLQGRGEEAQRYAKGLQLAEIQAGLKNYAAAEAALSERLKAEPGDLAALRLMTRGLEAQGKLAEAIPFCDRAVAAARELPPTARAELLLERAGLRLGLEQWDKAEADLREALAAAPRSAQAARLLALSLVKQNKPQDALKTIDALAGVSGADAARLLVARFAAALTAGDRAAAEDALKKAVKADPKAACLETPPLLKRSELDSMFFDVCLGALPREASLLSDRGVARYLEGRKDAAAEDLSAALKKRPDALEAALSLSSLLQDGRQLDKAREVISKSIAAAGKRKDEAIYRAALAYQAALAPAK